MIDLAAPFVMLGNIEWLALLSMFWFMIVLELPRYTLAFGAVLARALFVRERKLTAAERAYLDSLKLSVVIAGHNEAHAIGKCLRSLGEQTRRIDEIIVVDDGSTDDMRDVINELRRQGLITTAISNQVRCGKPAATNLGFGFATGDIIVNLDADCSLDRDAIEKLIEPFVEDHVGATCSPIAVRNHDSSAVTRWQAIEYLLSICLGKRALDMLGLVVCASGAFSAFRREALDQVGMLSAGSGEDFELTMRLRRAGWRIAFADQSWCFTDVPETVAALTRQRRRWDRDTIRIRFRLFRSVFNPFARSFSPIETGEQIEWCVLNLLTTAAFPIYLVWLFYIYAGAALPILLSVALVYLVLDTIGFGIALFVTRRFGAATIWSLVPYLLTFGLIYAVLMRCVRLYAYLEEWVWFASRNDPYSPRRVAAQAQFS